ncbi:hypothetical protein [Lysinibacillus telephonicus]|uniref:hypothetical protein n=1 Tax=Lysinibacillus telephonicus TaxID=1714840 RepID=UPI0037D647F2
MLFKEYKKKRIQGESYFNLFHTLQALYNDELDEMLVYIQDMPNQEYKNGRTLLVFCDNYLLKVTFDESNVEVRHVRYSDIQFAFVRKESRYPEEYEPNTLIININNEEIKLNPLKDFSPSVAMNYLNTTIDIFKLLLKK